MMAWWPAPLGSNRGVIWVAILIAIAALIGVMLSGYGNCC
jgi:hypothetical protein